MALTNSLSKPGGPPYILNGGSPQARGLVFWAAPGMSGAVQDAVQRFTSTYLVGTVPVLTPFGLGINCASNNLGARDSSPASLNGLLPVSLMAVFWQFSTPTTTLGANPKIFGLSHSNADATPFVQYTLGLRNSGANVGMEWNTAGSTASLQGAATPANGTLNVLIGSLASGAQAIYLNGTQDATGVAAVSAATSTTPQLLLGASVPTDRNAGIYLLDARIYDRALTSDDARAFTDQWTDLYYQPALSFSRRPASLTAAQEIGALIQAQVSGGFVGMVEA